MAPPCFQKEAVRLMSTYVRYVNKLSEYMGYVSAVFILIIAGSITYDVTVRALFNSPTIWVYEVTIYLTIASVMFGAAYALQTNSHIQVDMLINQLSPLMKKIFDIITSTLGTVLFALITVKGIHMVMETYEMNHLSITLLETPMYIPQMSIPIGSALLTLQFIARIIVAADFQRIGEAN